MKHSGLRHHVADRRRTCLCSITRCKCGGSRWLRKRRCTWGTSSDACRSASWRTRSRKRGSTLSAPRPSPWSCSTGTLNGPAGGKEWLKQKWWAGNGGHLNVFKSWKGKFLFSTHLKTQLHKYKFHSIWLSKLFKITFWYKQKARVDLVFADFFIENVISVADFLSWFLGFLNLSPEFGDVLLKDRIRCGVCGWSLLY